MHCNRRLLSRPQSNTCLPLCQLEQPSDAQSTRELLLVLLLVVLVLLLPPLPLLALVLLLPRIPPLPPLTLQLLCWRQPPLPATQQQRWQYALVGCSRPSLACAGATDATPSWWLCGAQYVVHAN